MIKVLFFASLRERLNSNGTQVDSQGLNTARDVRDSLLAAHPEWQEALEDERLLIAVNQTMAKAQAPVKDGDEVAFFPPVTGG